MLKLATLGSMLMLALVAVAFVVACPAPPSVTSVTPNSGLMAGGTTVTLSGANFSPSATVSFGANPATNVTVVSSTSITATTPPGTAGPVDVFVTNWNASSGGGSGTTSGLARGFTYLVPGVFTYQNDNMRTGQNLNEAILTPANVTSTTFGRLYSYGIDGLANAAPLYVASLNIPNQGVHNVVYVATEHDSVYAFDADGLSAGALWHVSFINPPNVTTVPATDTESDDIVPEIGISGTPVIDPVGGTLYVVAKTKEIVSGTTTYVQRLHALDLTTGAEKLGGPVVIQASAAGTGDGSQNGQIAFVPLIQNQHPALLLLNGVVYVGFSSHGDQGLYHGWILGFDATTLQLVMTYNSTPNGSEGGIWHGTGGLAADSVGDIYFVTGNGTFDANTGGTDFGDSVVKISPSGSVVDYFTPLDQDNMNQNDYDLGSGGPLLVPDQSGPYTHLLVTAGKTGTIYVVNRDNMGQYHTKSNQIPQTLENVLPGGTATSGNYKAPIYFGGGVYFGAAYDSVRALQLSSGALSMSSLSSEAYSFPGGALTISANGNTNAILWTIERTGASSPGVLHAYDATNLANEFYNSNQNSSDTLDIATKFVPPAVVNGKVFVASASQLAVYGLLP